MAQAAENGMYATAAVSAALLALGVYRLFGGGRSAAQGVRSEAGDEAGSPGVDVAQRSDSVTDAAASDPGRQVLKRAKVVYSETAGLRPLEGNEESAQALHEARKNIAIVSERNPRVSRALTPDLNNPIERRVWEQCVRAALEARQTDLDARIKNFFLSGHRYVEGSVVKPWKDQGMAVVWECCKGWVQYGPFINVGGGDVPAGRDTWVNFVPSLP